MSRRRIVKKAIVFLVLGAIVNVAVAWGCALWSRTRLFTRFVRAPDEAAESAWQDRPAQATAPHATAIWDYASRGCRYQMVVGDRSGDAFLRTDPAQTVIYSFVNSLLDRTTIVYSGFPMESLTGDRWDFAITLSASLPMPGSPVTAWIAGDVHRNAISLNRPRVLGGSSFRMLGWRPLWPGFAVNTVFYSVVLWILFAAPFALRRRRRIKRGLCPACGYQVGISSICSECGTPVTPKATAAG